jgi:hypothetical protein
MTFHGRNEFDGVKFALGEIVYLRVEPSEAGIVTGIMFRPSGVCYYVSWSKTTEQQHYDIELQREKGFKVVEGGDVLV